MELLEFIRDTEVRALGEFAGELSVSREVCVVVWYQARAPRSWTG